MSSDAPYSTPQRDATATPRSDKTGILIDGALQCPDNPERLLWRGNGTVQKCPACDAKIVEGAKGTP